MHRAISRAIGRQCRKWREENKKCTSTTISGEEGRKEGHKKHGEKYVPPPPPDQKYTLSDAVIGTAGLVLAYEFTHGRRRGCGVTLDPTPKADGASTSTAVSTNKCPFPYLWWPKVIAITQPVSLTQSVLDSGAGPFSRTIDVTPFIKEEIWDASNFDELERSQGGDTSFRSSASSSDLVSFREDHEFEESPPVNKVPLLGERFAGDLLGLLGAFKFLSFEEQGLSPTEAAQKVPRRFSNITPEDPPMSAMELMEAGMELGSARSLYNIGVAYDRMKDYKLAREYYNKASDLGHPLATYNSAVFLIKEGKVGEGIALMQQAAQNGVPEAKELIAKRQEKEEAKKKPSPQLLSQVPVN